MTIHDVILGAIKILTFIVSKAGSDRSTCQFFLENVDFIQEKDHGRIEEKLVVGN